MKKTILTIIATIMMPLATIADGYDSLWKQYKTAGRKDLPKTQIEILDSIATQAERTKNYGQLLRAEANRMTLRGEISPDSIMTDIEQLRIKAAQAEHSDGAISAIYYVMLGDAYTAVGDGTTQGGKKSSDKVREAYAKALANPELLAATKADGYQPFVEKGSDRAVFGGDLLNIIGRRAKNFRLLADFYSKTGNRRAALVAEIEDYRNSVSSRNTIDVAQGNALLARLDSIIKCYGDLPECGEAAAERYAVMKRCTDVSAAQKAQFITDAIGKWQSWHGIARLKNEYEELTQPLFRIETNRYLRPTAADTLRCEARNICNLKVLISRLSLSGNVKLSPDNDKEWLLLKKSIVPHTGITIEKPVATANPYDVSTFSIPLPRLQPGIYAMQVTANDKELGERRSLLFVSDLYVATMSLPNKQTRIAVLNAATGQPVAGAKICITDRDDKVHELTADALGEATWTAGKAGIESLRAYTQTDNFMQSTSAWGNFSFYGNKRTLTTMQIFTDRTIYRPGQVVHASVVAYTMEGVHSTKVAGGKVINFALYNANNKLVAEKKATTDDYGTASTDFTLPSAAAMSGRYSIRCSGNGNDRRFFRVEEYKRPTFRVEIDEVKTEYHNGDTVAVSGRATSYNGMPVEEAKVVYSVVRSENRLLWRSLSPMGGDAQQILSDTVATDEDGRFTLRIPVVLPEEYKTTLSTESKTTRSWNTPFFSFTAKAQITSRSGESHEAETVLRLGTKSTSLAFDMPEKVLSDSTMSVKFRRLNASGKEINGDVTYWLDSSTKRCTAKANEKVVLDWQSLGGCTSGSHVLHAVCATDTISQSFVIFSIGDTKPAVKTHDWAYLSSTSFPRDGKPVYVQVGSSDADTHIIYSMIAGDKVIEDGHINLSDSISTTPIYYKEEYSEGLLLNYLWVKDGVAYTHRYVIARPLQDKTLDIRWTTFRDKLTPGQKETWTLNISRRKTNDIINKKYIDAEENGSQLLALMYDKSLDQIVSNRFSFSLPIWQNQPSTSWNTMAQYADMLQSEGQTKWTNVKSLSFDAFRYDFSRLYWLYLGGMIGAYDTPVKIMGYGSKLMAKTEAATSEATTADGALFNTLDRTAPPMTSASNAMKKNTTTDTAESPTEDANAQQNGSKNGGTTLQMRENLQETAFFYPALYADKDGSVKFSFTLPESVTTWQFRGFAHDRNMNYGTIEAECVASKKVMISPNVPRFIRIGDKAQITALVANTTNKGVKTKVTMTLVDPLTEKAVCSRSENVVVGANASQTVTFGFAPNESSTLLVCRFTAEGKDFSDGEQHYLPVLPATERLINSVAFSLNGSGVKTADLKALFPDGAKDKKLTVEYTANPSWLMIQALPYMAEASDNNAISLISAYYANVLGRHIMQQSPVIKEVVALWNAEKGNTESTLMSQLEKNQELKTLVLDETPWVMEANRESDMKHMLASFFDESAIDYRIQQQYEALKKLQNADGSWSWWKGMSGSPSMTAQVAETLARLNMMTNGDTANEGELTKAMKYLAGIVEKEYDEMKRMEKNGQTFSINDSHAIQYLYINTLLDKKLSAKDSEIKNYLLAYLTGNRQRDIYAKALMATILHHDGKVKEAKEYVESIKQLSVTKDGMGRYFDSPRAAYSWTDYRIPTQVAAIEALKTVVPEDATAINEMRLWLLQSKRTQTWDTPINSVNAVYAFLDGNYSELGTTKYDDTRIAVDKKQVALPHATAGMGYVKLALNIDRQQTAMVEKRSNGTSWGVFYAQFSQDMASVAEATSGISVKREVIGGKDNGTSFAVGDKVKVCITIIADRDYDFVQVIDKRAACMEPVEQLSRYGWGYFFSPKDNATNYYFDKLSKGTHVIETEYFIDRQGDYSYGSCSAQCAYAPEFAGRTAATTLNIAN